MSIIMSVDVIKKWNVRQVLSFFSQIYIYKRLLSLIQILKWDANHHHHAVYPQRNH